MHVPEGRPKPESGYKGIWVATLVGLILIQPLSLLCGGGIRHRMRFLFIAPVINQVILTGYHVTCIGTFLAVFDKKQMRKHVKQKL